MGCCGRKSRAVEAMPVPRGQAVREISIRPVQPPPPLPRVQPTPAPPAPPAPRGHVSSTTIEPTKTIICKACGTRLVLKRVWSDRLRRYYNVSWCPGCKQEG
jgi:hypothetical protein